ncbi:hypothetical protein [Kutzneria sp. 744]|uniref:hypothetical protein n=1 Tax=Kutzneria sp. (strain 744) TaxID=345341 RepID=UPI0003EEB541|nr:hypothetical protein [Kutzneria sp. 744]EWM19752.1 hypothetical protein KUTG_10056 [Kutzneria sp. 744]
MPAPGRQVGIVLCIVVGAATIAACNGPPPALTPARPPATTVTLPPPDRQGPMITVDGEAIWLTNHPGCGELVLGSPTDPAHRQRLRLSEPIFEQFMRQALTGDTPATERVRLVGYIAEAATSPCSRERAFVIQQVTSAFGQ